MKTNKLFLGLFAGALLCFNNASYAQYHGGSDDAFSTGSNVFNVGVGFAGGLGGASSLVNAFAYNGSTYSASTSPGFNLSWEHGLNDHIGYGLIVGYQSVSFSDSYTQQNFVITGYDQFGNPIYGYSNANYTDKYKLTLITFAARAAYHFTINSKFDPYIGVTLGYATASFSFSSTNPDNGSGASISATGIAAGIQLGARYYLSSHIGLFAEFAYATNYAANYANVGLAFKL